MRVRPRALLLLLARTLVTVVGSEYGVPIEIQLWDTGRTPLAYMVDVTNEFGLKVLAEHNFLNDNNIAFSPYGLTGILVALYEGVDGESSYQIQRGMQLPWNRNTMRVGFRDIHRTLKTYFVPEEGFLAGLALNNENVTFNDSYKKILRFYGFDLDNDSLPTVKPQDSGNATNTTSASESGGSDVTSSTSAVTNATPREDNSPSSTPEREETTQRPSAATASDIDIRIPTESPGSSSAPNAESTTAQMTTSEQTSAPIITTETTTTTTVVPTTTQTTQQLTTTQTTQQPTTTQTTQQPTTTQTTQQPTTTQTTQQPTIAADTPVPETTRTTEPSTTTQATTATQATIAVSESTVNNEVEILSTPDASNTAPQTSADSTQTTSTIVPETVTPITETSGTNTVDIATTTLVTESTTLAINESTLETLERKKKSIVDFIFTNPPYMQDLTYYRSFDVGPEIGGNFGDKAFLANGLRSVQVTYMQYDTTLEHAYLPHLEASALRLPLDSDRYYLLVVLPSRAGPAELGRLLARMARESDLRDVHAALRPKRVRAIVPSFTVKGHVALTTDLQKLGVRDVFEPRQRDFTPMTSQAGVYVRSVEQAVSVAIRKYRPDDHKRNRYVTNRYPVHFSATYPFLYFVMDSSIHVALMAGKMVDPLNTRIL